MSVLASGLTVEIRKTADGQAYQLCTVVNGAVITWATRKTGGVDDQLAVAAEQAAAAAAAVPAPAPVVQPVQ
ncbi:MAG: hypothetical protein KGL35_30135 [Bradyrhizobium sp.]|nr:hypothetical protein [Bradyrhizobium sp.]